jgi:hypothetical protein
MIRPTGKGKGKLKFMSALDFVYLPGCFYRNRLDEGISEVVRHPFDIHRAVLIRLSRGGIEVNPKIKYHTNSCQID